jgi:hypothetical protein
MQLRLRHGLRSTLAAVVLAALALPFVVPAAASATAVAQSPKGFNRKLVLERAQHWVNLRIPYSQKRWYAGYRQDCSGFVSMSWRIGASYPTGMMDLIGKPIPKDAMLPGDVMLNATSTGAHVVLFAGWANRQRTAYVAYEQLSSTNRPVRRIVPYPYLRHPQLFKPFRFTGLPPDAPVRAMLLGKKLPKPDPAPRLARVAARRRSRPGPLLGMLAVAIAGAASGAGLALRPQRFPLQGEEMRRAA